LHIHASQVTRERNAREIPSFQKTLGRSLRSYPIDWAKADLGGRSDRAVGEKLGVSGSCVRYHRLQAAIPTFKEQFITKDWSKIPLGKVPDWMLAEKLGKSVDCITAARSIRGIKPLASICQTTEGETCNYPEGRIDLFFHEHDIGHKFQVRIGKFRADWVIRENLVVEFTGWERHPQYGQIYRERIRRKCSYYKSLGLKIWLIHPKDLKRFQTKEQPKWVRVCPNCRRPASRITRGWCSACYKRIYLRQKNQYTAADYNGNNSRNYEALSEDNGTRKSLLN
jgi:hypothetical protein